MVKFRHFLFLLLTATMIFAQTTDVKVGQTLMIQNHYLPGQQIVPWVYGENIGDTDTDFDLTCNVYEDDQLIFEETQTKTNIKSKTSALAIFKGPTIQNENKLIKIEFIISAAGDNNSSNDTLRVFATSNTLAKMILWERFTNTSCGPCAYAEPFNKTIIEANAEKVLPIYTHVWWPSNQDPFYQSNTADAVARRNFYGFNGVPSVFLDGINNPDAMDENILSNSLKSLENYGSPLILKASGKVEKTVNLDVEIECAGGLLPGNYKIFIAVVENKLDFNAPNGETHFNHTLRKYYPSADGTAITLKKGEKVSKNFSLELKDKWVLENCEVIVFVQNMTTKEVLQAAKMSEFTSVESKNDVPTEYQLSQNYPNPFNPTTKISYSIPEEGFVSLEVYNVLGQKIKILADELKTAGNYEVTFDANEFTSGMYLYRLKVNGYSEIKKMMLIK